MTRRNLVLAGTAASSLRAAGEPLKTVHSQPSWIVENNEVELAVTRLGGHMAPVRFHKSSGRPVQPYHISPWQDEGLKIDVPVLVPLRGDFFCLPFGGGKEPNGREHPAHGETATSPWTFADLSKKGRLTTLTLTMDTKVRVGKVTKKLMLVDGHNAVYSQHRIDGFQGPTTPGHHATIKLPKREGALRVASSPFVFGTTHPAEFADQTQGEYQSFAINAEVRDLAHVPLRFKDATGDRDMTSLPPRPGYVDLMAVFKKSAAQPAWMAVVNHEEQYIWFSLKEPDVLPATVFWLENKGRHGAPWSGRNQCLGLEDVCWYFDQSYQRNPASDRGIRTSVKLDGQPHFVNYIQGAIRAPNGFDIVKSVEFSPGSATFVAANGMRAATKVSWEFLKSGGLEG